MIIFTQYNLCREHPEGHDSPEPKVALRVKAQSAGEIAAECGSLGVKEVPEGEDPSLVTPLRPSLYR